MTWNLNAGAARKQVAAMASPLTRRSDRGLILTSAIVPSRAADDEVDFVGRASASHLMGMMESSVAMDRATDPQVRALAKRLLGEDAEAEAELEAASKGAGMQMATTLDLGHQAHVAALRHASGAEFD